MKAILAVNHFLKSEKFDELHNHIIKSAEKLGVEMDIRTNQELIFSEEKPDFVLFWDKDVNTARLLEKRDIQVFNSRDFQQVGVNTVFKRNAFKCQV